MGKDHKGDVKGFTHLSKSWYGEANLRNSKYTDEIMIGFYSPEGGTSGEFGVRWQQLGGKSTPQLQVFNDGWHAFAEMPELISRLKELDDMHVTPDDLSKILIDIGFKDLTQLEQDGLKSVSNYAVSHMNCDINNLKTEIVKACTEYDAVFMHSALKSFKKKLYPKDIEKLKDQMWEDEISIDVKLIS
ncbi:hypothetical protein KAR91_13790 [Candidatus Pacearchaeota archaeon]|nr:hypothetical protein [Candidatus Pacearchaeota archaeon]